jgi:hypothetical protein
MQAQQNYIKRIEEIRKLENGWADKNDGEKFSVRDLHFALRFLNILVKDHSIPVPFIYALPDNNISLEWDMASWMISIELDFKKRRVKLHCFNVLTSEVEAFDKSIYETEIGLKAVGILGKYFFN